MKYLQEPIYAKPPQPCGQPAADCPIHGFGIPSYRAVNIVQAIFNHGLSCRNQATGKADYARFMAGPDLELRTLAEVLFAGYYLGRVSTALQQWEAAQAQQNEVISEMSTALLAAQQVRNGGSVEDFDFGPNWPVKG